ncbi:PREDICTED: rab11 family-interacting protein 4A isoform X2 [Nicrophorus vespilloides]|uniref:Rab11 family-interacting protein 4A isoform X2 n=1 Tax=Nicrophorus vespilloides TaxID=110193 RepID=A0ABM1N267_NICVS|nr:PREDICTED: rab11 family-interacting protein 4A isoform X2 [Nicrophorus vespilloides]
MPGKRIKHAVSMKQLVDVFKICDPKGTGKVRIEYLLELATLYDNDGSKDLASILLQLDARGSGTLTFREFSYGIRAILRQRYFQERICALKDSMMSPITAAPAESHLENGGGGGVVSAGSEDPRFILSPPDSPRATGQTKSQCSSLSDGENYESYGEGPDIDADSGIANERHHGDRIRSPLNNPAISRHSWLRTSLRRSPTSHAESLPNRRWGSFRHAGKRQQLGSNALASQLYRSSSFNSSGRSSTCDTADDMYSDASLEEDVLDLNHKVQVLQQQMGVLQDSATHNDERYTRAKADNAALQARVIMLEEQLRDSEMRADERIHEEQRRSKELMARIEREKLLQLENSSIRLHAAEGESSNFKEEAARQRIRIEKLETERTELHDQLQDLRYDISEAKEQEHRLKEQERRLNKEHEAHNQLIEELSKEVERLRSEARTPALPTTSPEALRLDELHEEMASLREINSQLQEANEELQANLLHAGVEQGRKLTAGEFSLASELEEMTQDEIQQALKEQQEVNAQLRSYIDGILLNIVEKCPQLLERSS